MKIDAITRENLTEIGTLDFQRKSNLLAGYALRAAGVGKYPLGHSCRRGSAVPARDHSRRSVLCLLRSAAAAGGDFLGVAWLGKLPRESRLEDEGERLVAYRLGAEK